MACCEADFVTFEWEGGFLVTLPDVGGRECASYECMSFWDSDWSLWSWYERYILYLWWRSWIEGLLHFLRFSESSGKTSHTMSHYCLHSAMSFW